MQQEDTRTRANIVRISRLAGRSPGKPIRDGFVRLGRAVRLLAARSLLSWKGKLSAASSRDLVAPHSKMGSGDMRRLMNASPCIPGDSASATRSCICCQAAQSLILSWPKAGDPVSLLVWLPGGGDRYAARLKLHGGVSLNGSSTVQVVPRNERFRVRIGLRVVREGC